MIQTYEEFLDKIGKLMAGIGEFRVFDEDEWRTWPPEKLQAMYDLFEKQVGMTPEERKQFGERQTAALKKKFAAKWN